MAEDRSSDRGASLGDILGAARGPSLRLWRPAPLAGTTGIPDLHGTEAGALAKRDTPVEALAGSTIQAPHVHTRRVGF